MDNLSAESSTKTENRNFIVLDRSKPISSDVLFLRGDEVLIQHQGEQYRLRRTRNGKLILTK
jgi:hemin uptake protein HemP